MSKKSPNTSKIVINKLQDLAEKSIENKVICFGHFSYLHAGHIRYFNYASKQDKALCVAITSGPLDESGPSFNIDDRIKLLKRVCDVEEFIICDESSLSELINKLNNCELILGQLSLSHNEISEIEIRNLLGKVNSNLTLLEGDDGKLFETLSYSTEELTSKHVEEFKFRCRNNSIDLTRIMRSIDKPSNSKILVVGDLIVDEYVGTEPLGISAEAPVIVVREIESKKYVGGAGVVAKHLSSLGAKVSLLSVIGTDSEAEYIKDELKSTDINPSLIVDNSRPTVYKRRYISGYTKLLRVSRVSKSSLSSDIQEKFISQLEILIKDCDAIVISDFQYGVLSKKISTYIEMLSEKYDKKIFVDVQCSSQVGKINKLESCYAIFPTEKEARLTTSDVQADVEHLGQKIISICNSKFCILKLGEEGLILFERDSQKRFHTCIKCQRDVAGAGDSLLASVVFGFVNGLDMKESVALGSIVASLNVENLGNEPVVNGKISGRIASLF